MNRRVIIWVYSDFQRISKGEYDEKSLDFWIFEGGKGGCVELHSYPSGLSFVRYFFSGGDCSAL